MRPVSGQQHIGRLQVPVDQAAVVHRLQRLGQPGGEPPQRGLGQRAVLGDDVIQRRSRHVHGRQPWRVVVEPGGHHRRRVQAADRAGGGDLVAEPGEEFLIPGKLRVDHLDGHRTARGGVGEVDAAHPARAQPGTERELACRTWIGWRKRLHPCSREKKQMGPAGRDYPAPQALSSDGPYCGPIVISAAYCVPCPPPAYCAWPGSLSRAMFRLSTLTAGSPRIPMFRPSVYLLTSACTCETGRCLAAATRLT